MTRLFLWLLLVMPLTIAAASAPPLAITDVTVIDVVRGERVGPRTVLVRNGRIVAVEKPAAAVTRGMVRVDGRGLYLTPGLVDMHVHLFNNSSGRPPNDWAFPLFVANGVTGVREMRTEPAEIAQVRRWRREVETGKLIAPRVLAAGVAVDGENPAVARWRVRIAKAAGADFIKVFSEVPSESWRAILAEARKLRIDVCGHVPAQVRLLTAARAGQRTNEHLMQVYEACSPKESELVTARQRLRGKALIDLRDAQEREVLATFNQNLCEQLAAKLARMGQTQVPTLVLPWSEANALKSEMILDPRWHFLRADEQARWVKILTAMRSDDAEVVRKRWEVSREIVRAFHAAKVPILAGTDTPMPLVYPGFSLHDELELLVECGFTPAEALRAATIGPAEFLGLRRSDGSIAVGKRADLLLLEADPLARVENLRRIRAVVLAGRLLLPPDLEIPLQRPLR
jgi:imidazolonepropionase-like amidohydrolase